MLASLLLPVPLTRLFTLLTKQCWLLCSAFSFLHWCIKAAITKLFNGHDTCRGGENTHTSLYPSLFSYSWDMPLTGRERGHAQAHPPPLPPEEGLARQLPPGTASLSPDAAVANT